MAAPVDVLDRDSTSVFDADTSGPQGQWVARPLLARLVRVAVVVLPVLLGTTAAIVVARNLPEAADANMVWGQRCVVVAVAVAVAWVAGPLAKRLLPLSALLQLTLVFPDAAPRRMTTAFASQSTAELAELVATTRRDGLPSDSAAAAGVVLRLVSALSAHDRITRGHSERVRAYAVLIGKELGLAPERLDALGWAGLLHDVGKLTVDAQILNKPTRLNDDEYAIIKTHALAGQEMVEPLRGWLGGAVDAVGQHHERWDGAGYPLGLQGDEISLEARIMAVADVFDVITAARSYKAPSSPAEAREEIARCAGTQFDPEVVRAFLAISVGELGVRRGPLAMLAQLPVAASISAVNPMPALGSAATSTALVAASTMTPMAAPAAFPTVGSLETPEPVVAVVVAGDDEAVVGVAPADAATVPSAPSRAADDTAPSPAGDRAPTTTAVAVEEASDDTGPAAAQPDDAYARARAEALRLADVERAAVDAALQYELTAIDVEHLAKVQEAHLEFDEEVADAQAEREEELADLVEERTQLLGELEDIDGDLAADLGKLDERLQEDLAKIDRRLGNGKLTVDAAAAERAALQVDHAEDVARMEADAEERRARESDKLGEAERDLEEAHARAMLKAETDLADALAKQQRGRDQDVAEARDRATRAHAAIDEALATRLQDLDAQFGR